MFPKFKHLSATAALAACLLTASLPLASNAQTSAYPPPDTAAPAQDQGQYNQGGPAYPSQDPPSQNYPAPSGPAQNYPPPAYQAPAYPPPPQGQDTLSWIPQGMNILAQQASWHTDFTFDRSMLALAGNLYGLDEPTRQSLGRLNGISVHSYRFRGPGAYNPAELDAVRAQYNALGWKHVVTAHTHTDGAGYAKGQTDLWIATRGINVAGCAILLAGPSNLNLIAVSGDLSTMDLLHLRGHFGIPQFSDNALPPMH